MSILPIRQLRSTLSSIGYPTEITHESARINFDRFIAPVDTVVLSKPYTRKIETVNEILKTAKSNGVTRFKNAEDRKTLKKVMLKFNSSIPDGVLLKELLKIKYADGSNLSTVDIASFLEIMNGSTKPQIKATLNLMNFYLKKGIASNSDELNETLFLPLENNPNLIKHIGNCEYRLSKDFPETERAEILHKTLNIIKFSGYKHTGDFLNIAKIIAKDKDNFRYTNLLAAAQHGKKQEFKKALAMYK